MNCGIYEIRNTLHGKCYIGAAINIKQRLYVHKSALRRNKHHNKELQKDWNIHGEAGFSFKVLEYLDESDYVGARERYWITVLKTDTFANGYNVNKGACGAPGVRQPINEQRRQKLIENNIKRWQNPEYKERVSKAISAARRGQPRKPHSPETYAKIAAANRARAHLQVGVPLPQSTRDKMSSTRLGQIRGPYNMKRY